MMKVMQCCNCGHIEFDEAPASCLICNSVIDAFEEKPDAIKKPADPDNLTDGDKKHIPQIVVVKECGLIPGGSCTDVHVRVGEIEHVMQADHYIRYIDYYVDRSFVARTWLSPEACHPAAGLHLKVSAGSSIIALENCNVHGNWMSETTV